MGTTADFMTATMPTPLGSRSQEAEMSASVLFMSMLLDGYIAGIALDVTGSRLLP
jgi:hypothetical protein